MKIRADRRELADALTWVASALPKRPAVPVLSSVRVTAAGDTVTLSSFDYEVSHVARVPAELADPGELLAPGAFTRSLVSGLRSKEVELASDGAELTISGGRSSYQTRTLNLADYPNLPDAPASLGVIGADDLLAAVAVVEHAVDDASPHEQVRGLRMVAADGLLTFVGMDRFRIAVVELAWPGEDFAITVPARSLLAATKGLSGPVQIGVTEGSFGLTDASRTVVLRPFSEGYNTMWSNAIAPTEGAAATLPADEMLSAVKRAGGLSDDVHAAVNVTIEDSAVRIDVNVDDVGAGSEVLDASTTGDGATGLLNAAYLSALLATIPGGDVTLTRPASNRPWLLAPTDHPHIRLALMGRTKR